MVFRVRGPNATLETNVVSFGVSRLLFEHEAHHDQMNSNISPSSNRWYITGC